MNLKTFLFFILLLVFFSCKKEDLDLIQNLEYFDEITFESYFDVELIQGNEHKLEFIGNEKVIQKIDFTVQDSVLKIKKSSSFSWLNPDKNKIKIRITFQDLKQLNVMETCDITNKDTLQLDILGILFASKLNQADLKIKSNGIFYYNNHPCGGKLKLSGTCDYLKIWNFALMQVDASNLISNQVLVENSSKGDCQVYTQNLIEYSIFGEGNIYCYGNPIQIIAKTIDSKGKFYLK